MKWAHIHGDWWQSPSGEQIHRIEILDDDDRLVELFYGYLKDAARHCCEALSLSEARLQMEGRVAS